MFGAIFGALYSRLHDPIPGKGISKGFNFGLMIWLIKDIAAGAFVPLLSRHLHWTIWIALIFIGFFKWITYGSLLGALYKKCAISHWTYAIARMLTTVRMTSRACPATFGRDNGRSETVCLAAFSIWKECESQRSGRPSAH